MKVDSTLSYEFATGFPQAIAASSCVQRGKRSVKTCDLSIREFSGRRCIYLGGDAPDDAGLELGHEIAVSQF